MARAIFAIILLTNGAINVLIVCEADGDCLLILHCSYGRTEYGPIDTYCDCEAVRRALSQQRHEEC